MNLYSNQENPHWANVQRAMFNQKYLTTKEQEFINDLNRKGPDYRMSEKQHRWLSGIMHKIGKQRLEAGL
jgi:hypothetical protein